MTTLPRILTDGRTPEAWCEEFAARGIEISPRTLREKARKLGACQVVGKAMMLLPEHIDRIWEDGTCRSSSTKEKDDGGSEGGSTTSPAVDTIAAAQAHLRKAARAGSSPRSKPARSNVTMLEPKRR